MDEHRKKLQELAPTYSGIKKRIAGVALIHDDLLSFFNQTTFKPDLDVYLGDMNPATFFARYYEDIEHARKRHEKDTGTPVMIQGDTMQFLSSLAIGIRALEVATECGFEISKKNGSYVLK